MNGVQRFLSRALLPKAESTSIRSPASWFMEALFGQREAASGVKVSEAVALSLSAYYCGVSMIAETIASLPLNVYKQTDKKREVWDRHPAHRLLHKCPNPEMTAMSMRESWVFHAISRGNCYGQIIWDARGEAKEIWILPPHITKPVMDDQKQLWYEVRPWDGEARYLKPEDVIHVAGMGYDGIMGYGLIQVARDSIGLNAAQEQYASKFFRNGGNISGVLETDKILDDKQFSRLKSEVAQKLQGLDNAHRIAILENNMKFKPMNPTHREAQLIEERRFTIEEWARWLKMPPHKLKEMGHSTFSNIEEQNIEWVVDTIRPWLVRFEQEFNRKLFRKQSVFYTKHVVEGLLRGDTKTRYDAYAVGRNWGWLSVNDIRELEDQNPIPNGDMYLVPMNMQPIEKVGAEPEPSPIPPTSSPDELPEGEEGEEDDPAAQPPTAKRFASAAAQRLIRFESRVLKQEGSAAYVKINQKIRDWLFLSQEQSDDYCKQAMQLNLIAEEQEITIDELEMRKSDLLEQMVLGELK